MLFLNRINGNQRRILQNLKEKSGLSWPQIAKELQVNRSMIFFYLNEKCKIPKTRLERFCNLAGEQLESQNLSFVEENQSKEKEIKKPELNEELSEFLGILSGDGCLENNGYAVTVTCGMVFDKKYINEKVAPMFESLFGLKPVIFGKKGVIHCRVYSKRLWHFISEEFCFPIGEKKGLLKIPEKIISNEKLLKAFLRGLFDTDGGIHKHHKNSAQLQITSYSTEFREQVFNCLRMLGFKAGMTCENINIYKKAQIDKFFKEIGSSNERNLKRYLIFKETSIVPSQKELSKNLLGGL